MLGLVLAERQNSWGSVSLLPWLLPNLGQKLDYSGCTPGNKEHLDIGHLS